MDRTVTIVLDEETAEYLEHIASGQGRTPAEVAAWIVTEDLRRERAIDEELVRREVEGTTSSRSLYGLWADLGPGPGEEEIGEARREMWVGFPREDVV